MFLSLGSRTHFYPHSAVFHTLWTIIFPVSFILDRNISNQMKNRVEWRVRRLMKCFITWFHPRNWSIKLYVKNLLHSCHSCTWIYLNEMDCDGTMNLLQQSVFELKWHLNWIISFLEEFQLFIIAVEVSQQYWILVWILTSLTSKTQSTSQESQKLG